MAPFHWQTAAAVVLSAATAGAGAGAAESPSLPPSRVFALEGFATLGGGTTGGGSAGPGATGSVWRVLDARTPDPARTLKSWLEDDGPVVVELRVDVDLGALGNQPQRPLLSDELVGSGLGVIRVGSDKTLFSPVGATLRHGTLELRGSRNVVLRNVRFRGLWEWDDATAGDYDRQGWDFVVLSGARNVWIDHCDFGKVYDAPLDIVRGSDLVTVSWSRFGGDDEDAVPRQIDALERIRVATPGDPRIAHYAALRERLSVDEIVARETPQRKGTLVGNSDDAGETDRGRLNVTFHHNVYEGVRQRTPRARFGNVHVYDTRVDQQGITSGTRTGVFAGREAAVLVENTLFRGVSVPLGKEGGRIAESPAAMRWNDPAAFVWRDRGRLPYAYRLDPPSELSALLRHAGVVRARSAEDEAQLRAWLVGPEVPPARPAATREDTYRNPVLHADYSDPDVVRVGQDFYMTASSFQAVPGLPILHSRDLVRWTLIGHAAPRLPSPDFDRPQHGNGLWAPSLRHHGGWFWIYVGDPDRGIYRTRARDPRGPWEPLVLVAEGRGLIDPCPLWDDDGTMYLVHAWARSRAGFNGVLTVRRLDADGARVIGGRHDVFAGGDRHPTIEGPKFYRRGGWYYVFAPAGGVRNGWQTVLRARTVLGPYEDRIVLAQGRTQVNGPHQGAWVDTASGEDWFLHFQDKGPYGRVVHLQPMRWVNDWPVIGEDRDGDGTGEPVASWRMPDVAQAAAPVADDPSDPFDRALRLHWQWHGNPQPEWASLDARPGVLRLRARPAGRQLWSAPHLLLQKLPAPAFTATAQVDPSGLRPGERAGLVVMGADYSALVVERTESGLRVAQITARGADQGGAERTEAETTLTDGPAVLRASVAPEALVRFAYRVGDGDFVPLGRVFAAQEGRWIGAKVGLFAEAAGVGDVNGPAGHADFGAWTVTPEGAARSGIVVAADGGGDVPTIQEALDRVPRRNTWPRTVVARPGVYREKLRIETPFVGLVGEDRARTRIEFAELRRNWRASHPDDWGAAVINVAPAASDVVIANLTVHNDYGRRHGDHDHQFAIRSMGEATRIALLNVDAVADGGDTVSLWNVQTGLTYYADSRFEGHVDFLCPRGWAYATNSTFFGHSRTASLWHDGSASRDQKFVVRRSVFDGVPGFALGRHHRDAQIYVLDARFSANMANLPIAAAKAPDPLRWGTRVYYARARRAGTDAGGFAWHADNLHEAAGAPRDEDVTAEWTFGGRWSPARIPPVLPFAAVPDPEDGWPWVEPAGTELRWTAGRDARRHRVFFGDTDPPAPRGEREVATFETGPLVPGRTYHWRVDTVTGEGTVVPGRPWTFRADPRAVRIVLAGDSTVTETNGWGAGFKARVGESAAVINLARGGRSSKSFRAEGHWAEVLRRRPTHVLIQFGHNDQPGKGLGRESDPSVFRANMERYVDEVRAAGATPILVTSLTRRRFTEDGRLVSDLEPYAQATRDAARAKHAALIDLHALSIAALMEMGREAALALGPPKADGSTDNTHLTAEGGALFGALVADELGRVAPELVPHLRRTGPAAKTP